MDALVSASPVRVSPLCTVVPVGAAVHRRDIFIRRIEKSASPDGVGSEQPDCDLVFSNITPEPLPREASCVLCSPCRSAAANRSPPRPVIGLLLLPCVFPDPVFYFSLSFC